MSLIFSYLKIVSYFWDTSYSGKYMYLVFLFMSGLMSRTFQLLAFFLALRILKNQNLINLFHEYTGLDGRVVGTLSVFLVMIIWASASKFFNVRSEKIVVYLENVFVNKIIKSQHYFHKQKIDWEFPYSENVDLINKYPKILAKSGKCLFLIVMYFSVIVLVLLVLFFINNFVTMLLLAGLLLVTFIMPRMHKSIKTKKANLEELNETMRQPKRDVPKMIQDADSEMTADEICTTLGEPLSTVHGERVKLANSVENSAYMVNLFFSCVVAGLLAFYLYEMEKIGPDVIAELAIYIVLIRFLSSYSSTLFRNLSNFNSEFQYVSKFVYYFKKYNEHSR